VPASRADPIGLGGHSEPVNIIFSENVKKKVDVGLVPEP
jgi:hypothetical protein